VRQRLLTQKTTCDSTIDAIRHRIKNDVRQHAGCIDCWRKRR